MGLDQYAYIITSDGKEDEVAYWRSFRELNHFMMDQYFVKTGSAEFNNARLEIDLELIDKLIKYFIDFDFIRSSSCFEFQYKNLFGFVGSALWHLSEGNKVYYTANW